MIPAIVVFLYLATVLYIGIFAFRRARGKEEAEDYFLASRSLGPFVFLFSLFGTNMTAFAILGSSGHAFTNGIVTFGFTKSKDADIENDREIKENYDCRNQALRSSPVFVSSTSCSR